MPTITVLEADSTTETDVVINDNGRAAAAASKPVALSTEDLAAIDGLEAGIAATNTLLTTQAGYLDGVETAVASTNTKLDTIAGHVDGLETATGIVTETAPASDTASSGLNGRLQRIAQRITSLIALLPASLGWKAAGASLSITSAYLEYETVAASQTDQVLGATGAAGDYLSHIIIQPTTTAAGTVTVKDNSTVIFTFTSGTLGDLRPITVPLGLISTGGSWKITTGANVAVIGVGDFT